MQQQPSSGTPAPYRQPDRQDGSPSANLPQPSGDPRGQVGPPAGGWPGQAPPPAVVVVASHKSVALAAVLARFFGPLGMLCSTVLGAVVMFFVSVVVAAVTFGFGLLLVWPACVVRAAVAANNHNDRLAAIGVQRL